MDRGDIWYKSFLDLAEDNAQLKADLRKLVKEWDKQVEAGGSTYTKRCVEDIRKLINKWGGE